MTATQETAKRATGPAHMSSGFAIRRLDSGWSPQGIGTQTVIGECPKGAGGVLVPCLARSVDVAPELQTVIDVWRELPEAIRVGIIAMVQAAGR